MKVNPIRILVVDDSPIVRSVLKRVLDSDSELKVVYTAINGSDALLWLESNEVDLILTDLNMPVMDGHELVKKIMNKKPKPIIVFSNAIKSKEDQNVFTLLEAGALEVFPKPAGIVAGAKSFQAEELLKKIKILSSVKLPSKTTTQNENPLALKTGTPKKKYKNFSSVFIGVSTGGPQTLLKLLNPLPSGFPIPIIIAQHISQGFIKHLTDWLNRNLSLKVTTATEQNLPQPNHVYFAPDDAHLTINSKGRFQIVKEASTNTPSINKLFDSVGHYYHGNALGILLTGMGKDGARGLKSMRESGNHTIGQDKASSIVYGMPKAAAEIGACDEILSLNDLSNLLLKLGK